MDSKKKYTKADFDSYTEAVRREFESTLLRQRERIDELKTSLAEAEKKIAAYESQKELVYRAITAALKKADDIERVSLIKYNQEIAQLKSFHEKWLGYYNDIIAKYPLDDHLIAASNINRKISDALSKTGDLSARLNDARNKLKESMQSEAEQASAAGDEYSDRSPAGFSFAEALHPKDDLKDIMRELGIIIDD